MTPHNERAIAKLEPAAVWRIFAELASVPRPSKHETAIQAFVKQWAEARGLTVKHEPVGNVIVHVPATPGYERAPTVAIQGHLDMVAEQNAGTEHDFLRDPIRLVMDKDAKTGAAIVRADGTTLGADNGMGVALALAAATEKDVVHGPLEILCTCDEEAGMTGAKAVTPDTISARRLINLDSEEDDALYIGCAGGADSTLSWDLPLENAATGSKTAVLRVRGLVGGHSGCDIHLNRGNAIKLLAHVLESGGPEVQVGMVTGGSKRNAIPREAMAVIAAPAGALGHITAAAAAFQQQARRAGEGKCEIVVERDGGEGAARVTSAELTARIVRALLALPSGVLAVVPDIPGLVQTSSNLSTLESAAANGRIHLEIGCLSRSSSMDDLRTTVRQVLAVGQLASAEVAEGDSYPGWQPNPQSALLALCRTVYQECFGQAPHVRAIHAGLECGIIGEALGGGIDMISFGPTIQGAHSPDERVQVESVGKVWTYLRAVLSALTRTGGRTD